MNTKKKLKTYFVQIPDYVNSLEFNAFNKIDARKLCSEFLNIDKLPKGTLIYK